MGMPWPPGGADEVTPVPGKGSVGSPARRDGVCLSQLKLATTRYGAVAQATRAGPEGQVAVDPGRAPRGLGPSAVGDTRDAIAQGPGPQNKASGSEAPPPEAARRQDRFHFIYKSNPVVSA